MPSRDAAIMLRAKAIELLLAKLEDESLATLQVHVDGGLFRVSLTAQTLIRGDAEPILTNALVSLAEKLS